MLSLAGSMLLIAGLALGVAAQAQTSGDKVQSDAGAGNRTSAVTGQAFSALKYARTVKVLPDGKLKVLEEANVMAVARDSEGRVRIEFAGDDIPECANLGLKAMEDCPNRIVSIFDPAAETTTHWGNGSWSAPGVVVVRMSSGQVEDVERFTLSLPEDTFDWKGAESDGAVVTRKKLGEKQIEGIRAIGVRTTVVIPAGHAGNKEPITTIHEVWASAEMQLVVKTIDGDPAKELRISGLEHVSLGANDGLFRRPEGVPLFSWTDRPEYADVDVKHLAWWFVTSDGEKE